MKVKCIDPGSEGELVYHKVYEVVRDTEYNNYWLKGCQYSYLKDRFVSVVDTVPAPPPVHKEEKMFAKCIDASVSQEILVAVAKTNGSW